MTKPFTGVPLETLSLTLVRMLESDMKDLLRRVRRLEEDVFWLRRARRDTDEVTLDPYDLGSPR